MAKEEPKRGVPDLQGVNRFGACTGAYVQVFSVRLFISHLFSGSGTPRSQPNGQWEWIAV